MEKQKQTRIEGLAWYEPKKWHNLAVEAKEEGRTYRGMFREGQFHKEQGSQGADRVRKAAEERS